MEGRKFSLLLALALICSLALGSAPSLATGNKSANQQTALASKERVLHFPPIAIGKLSLFRETDFSHTFVKLASGDVTVPDKALLMLKVNFAGTENLNALKPFKNDISALALSDFSLTDEDLLPVLKEFTNLQWIDLSNTEVSDKLLLSLVTLKKLRFLDISRTNVKGSGLAAAKNWPDLQELYITHDMLDQDALNRLPVLKKLLELRLGTTGISDQNLIGNLKKFPALTHLQLNHNTKITNATIKALEGSHMWTLSLPGTSVTIGCLPSLKKMHQLHNVIIDAARFSAQDFKAIKQGLPKTQVKNEDGPRVAPELFAPLH